MGFQFWDILEFEFRLRDVLRGVLRAFQYFGGLGLDANLQGCSVSRLELLLTETLP